MYLLSIASEVPQAAFSQEECWECFSRSRLPSRLTSRSVQLLKKILLGKNGIDQRHFAIDALSDLFDRDAETLNHAFEREAPALARKALEKALLRADLEADQLDALFVSTCTGYLCPGVSSHVAEQMRMRSDLFMQDLVGLGCGAAIPALRGAWHMGSSAARDKPLRVAVIAVEVCSAAFYLDNDPGVLVSAGIFGDGASATIWSNHPGSTGLRLTGFDTIHLPESREILRFVNSGGKLKNRLDRTVPRVASDAVRVLWERRSRKPNQQVVSHGGGCLVLDALELVIGNQDFSIPREILRQYGNMSSPSVLFALERHLEQGRPAPVWLVSFGAGFSAHSCSLEQEGSGPGG